MIRKNLSVLVLVIISFFVVQPIQAQGQLDPVRLSSMTVAGGIGAGAHYFGNGAGFGPAIKGVFEKGMWDFGPGIITIGGEMTISFFSQRFGDDYRETWTNLIFGGRAIYHYGWDIEGLDTYAGLPAGVGFCGYSDEGHPGSAGAQTVYPYFGFILGGSWFFNKELGINAELGYNSTYANVGLIYKIR